MKVNGSVSLNFADPEASRCLAKAILSVEYGLVVDLPKGHLIPAIPNRLNYLLWIEDLLAYAEEHVHGIKGIDIGTGPSCIYPLLGTSLHKDWSFVATDIDSNSISVARQNVSHNNLSDRITLVHNTDPSSILKPIFDQTDDTSVFAFCMTNPPFYDGQEDLDKCRALKGNAAPDSPEYTASEYFFQGGELAFIKIMVEESQIYKYRCIWYTSTVAKKSNLKLLQKHIKAQPDVKTIHWTRFIQGNISRWMIAWSHYAVLIKDREEKKKKPAKSQEIINLIGAIDNVLSLLKTLGIECEQIEQHYIAHIARNTWCRRSRRGHESPHTMFDILIVAHQEQISFTLQNEHLDKREDFLALISHIQRKCSMKVKK